MVFFCNFVREEFCYSKQQNCASFLIFFVKFLALGTLASYNSVSSKPWLYAFNINPWSLWVVYGPENDL